MPQMFEALAPMVLGTSMRMQPEGVDGLLEPIATITAAIAAMANSAPPNSTMRRSRGVVSLRGVLTRPQWPSSGTNGSLEAGSAGGFDRVSRFRWLISTVWRLEVDPSSGTLAHGFTRPGFA